jgi:serine/threonine-protein kinase
MSGRNPRIPPDSHSGAGYKPATEINGFQIIDKIGQGAMGAVFKARQRSLDREVALKILPPRIAVNASFIERFQREARTSARLCHPNIVQGIDVGQDPKSKLWYFAMEYVDGPSLKALIEKRKRIEERRALEIVGEVAAALEAIDHAGMVHRDIKPDNILLNSSGAVKVADLGLARACDSDAGLTQVGQTVGTPHYMSPEQVRGEIDVDIRADIYALGATLFHMVTGKAPFTGGTSIEIMTKHLHDLPPSASEVSPNVSADCAKLIAKMMEKKREDREQTPHKLRKRIDALLGRDAAAADAAPAAPPHFAGRLPSSHGIRPAARHDPKGHATHAAPRNPAHRTSELPLSEQKRINFMIGAGAVAVILIVGLLAAISNAKPAPERPAAEAVNSSAQNVPVRVEAKDGARVAPALPRTDSNTKVPAETAAAGSSSGFDITGGEDIHESIARGKLDEIERLNKAGKLTPADLQARYRELCESSLRGTHAGLEAAERLKKLPPLPPAPPPSAAPSAAKGVWWEGEDALDHNFISHPWLAEQLDKHNLSGGKYLNHLQDEKWFRIVGKTAPNSLHASFAVEVPADATYTLWVREYDPYAGAPWKFKWDDARWFAVPSDYPFENKVEIGQWRNLVWRSYPSQTLTKGRHTFNLEAAIDSKHGVAGFDCFYLTTEQFKPDGAKRP